MDVSGLRQEAEVGRWVPETGPADALHPPRRGTNFVKKGAEAALCGTRLGHTETRTGPCGSTPFSGVPRTETLRSENGGSASRHRRRLRHFPPALSDWMIFRPTGSHSPASSSVTLNDTTSMRPSTEVAVIMFSIFVSAASERNSSCTHSVPL